MPRRCAGTISGVEGLVELEERSIELLRKAGFE
jgi:hypothetical protein